MSLIAEQAARLRASRSLGKDVVLLATPAIAEQLLFTVVQMFALMIVGNLGANAIAAVGISNQLHWLFQSAFWAFGAGTTTLVARFVGAEEPESATSALKQAMTVSAAISLVVSAFGFALAPVILGLMGAKGDVLSQATTYLRLAFAAMVFQSISMCLSAALRGAGDTRTPFKVGAAGAIMNVIVIYLLVGGRLGLPRLGVAGAGVGMLLSAVVVSMAYIAIMTSGKSAVRLSQPLKIILDTTMIKRLLTVGVPAALEQLLMSLGMTVFTRLVVSLGTNPYAAHQIAVNITSVSFMTGFGFSMAATALVGRSLGSRQPKLAEDYAITTSRLGVSIMAVLGATFYFAGSHLTSLYTNDPEIIQMGGLILRLAAFVQPSMALYSILAGALRGAGDTRYPLYITFTGMWTLRIALSYYLVQSLGLGLVGVWLAVNADQSVRAGLVVLRFRTGKWKVITV